MRKLVQQEIYHPPLTQIDALIADVILLVDRIPARRQKQVVRQARYAHEHTFAHSNVLAVAPSDHICQHRLRNLRVLICRHLSEDACVESVRQRVRV